jgi:hypothetical protein
MKRRRNERKIIYLHRREARSRPKMERKEG